MDNRQATRAQPPPPEPPATRSTVAARGVSGSRKSPARKSPARKSPSRRSAASVSTDTKSTASARPASHRGRRDRVAAKKTDSESGKKSTDSSQLLAPLLDERLLKATARSTTSSKTTSTTSYKRIIVSMNDEVNDRDVTRVTTSAERPRLQLSMSRRLSATPSEHSRHTHSMSRSVVDTEEHSEDENEPPTNDGASSDNYASRNAAKQLLAFSEFGGSLGAIFWIVVISALGFSIPFFCTRQECNGSLARLGKLTELATFISIESCYLFFGFSWALFLVAAIPMNRLVSISSDRGPVYYPLNGIVSGISALAALFTAEYLKYPVMKTLYMNYQQLAFLSIIYALILAGWCYARSKWQSRLQWNAYARSDRFWADYFIGREINPRWFELIDIKLVHYRVAVISGLLLNSIFAYKTFKFAALPLGEDGNVTMTVSEVVAFAYHHVKFDAFTALVAGLACIYLIDLLLNEHHLTNSFELQGEGVGAMLLLRYALFPFNMSILSKYAFDHKLSALLPKWVYPLVGVLFVAGVIVKRRSDKLKYEFRLNPGHSKFAELETLPTFQGRRLITSVYWGSLRQPNYLGDILSHLSLLIPLIWTFAWPPLVAHLLVIIFLVHRARRVNNRNMNKYNSAWARYCQRVPYMLLPRIY